MPALRKEIRSGGRRIGGAIGYPLDQLYEEVAYVAYHLHWPRSQLMKLDHLERHRWVSEVAKINRRINDAQTDPME
ncbi:DUF6760 family protein [Trinickia violacea]|uniref:DUF6760 family protein n=1 Tax=Trinickia violacea TaxID=2571746 RepID=UPI0034668A85